MYRTLEPDSESTRLEINGIRMPPQSRMLSQEEMEQYTAKTLPSELSQQFRFFEDHCLIVPDTYEHQEFLRILKGYEKTMRSALHNLLRPMGFWAHTSKPSGLGKNLPRLSFLLRPPFLSSELPKKGSNRLAPHPREIMFVVHLDDRFRFDGIRRARLDAKNVDHQVMRDIRARKDIFEQNNGNWLHTADVLSKIVDLHRSELLESLEQSEKKSLVVNRREA